MRTHVVRAKRYSTRISRHRIDPEWIGDKLGKQAQDEEDWLFDVVFGFDPLEAPENGRLPDRVECCLVVSSPLGLSVAFLSSCSGRITSKVTATNVCVPEIKGVGDIWKRNAKKARLAAKKLMKLHAEHWTEMEILGAMAFD